MLTKRIIPCLDVLDGAVVKGVHFRGLKRTGSPNQLAKLYAEQGADEIVFLDVGASPGRRKLMCNVVTKTASKIFIPLTVGGGIRTLKDIETTLHAGADKVSINTAAVKNPELIRQGAKKFGSQCIVVAIDGKQVKPSTWKVYIMGGRSRTDIDALEWAAKAEKLGAGEILLTSMDADGTQVGYDMNFTRTVCETVNIPVIASGGAGKLEHVLDVLTKGKADAALAASIFHYGQHSVRDLKKYLHEHKVPVRL